MAAFNVLFNIFILLLRNTVLMFQKNLQTCFDVTCSRRLDRTRKTTNVTTYKQNEPSIILLVDSKSFDEPALVYDMS